MTISAGHVTGEGTDFLHGGAVSNLAGSMLSLVGVAVSGTTLEKTDASSGAVRGAGIANNGTLSIADSTVSGNTEVATEPASGNSRGLFNSGGTVSITNSTFGGNSQIATYGATASGAAIENLGTEIPLLNVTVAANPARPRSTTSPRINTRNSIFSNAPGGNCDGTLTSQGSQPRELRPVRAPRRRRPGREEPLLGPLADNGGQTDTLALLPGSPAINRGTACPPTDQRGVARRQGTACDVGAFELVPAIVTPRTNSSSGGLKRNTAKGTAILFVSVPGPGTLPSPTGEATAGRSTGRPRRWPRGPVRSSCRSWPRARRGVGSIVPARPR